MVCIEECAQQAVAVVVVHAGLAGEHLQYGVPVELVIRIALGENFEHENICRYAADEPHEGERRNDFEKLDYHGA